MKCEFHLLDFCTQVLYNYSCWGLHANAENLVEWGVDYITGNILE